LHIYGEIIIIIIIVDVETELYIDREICERRVQQRAQMNVTRALVPLKEQDKKEHK
jgi:hypothetical protein